MKDAPPELSVHKLCIIWRNKRGIDRTRTVLQGGVLLIYQSEGLISFARD